MSDHGRRDWANNIRRLSEADDAAAVSFGRDLIKFGQWLNAGAIAALPIVANALDLRGADALAKLGLPGLSFSIGLVCSFASTFFAFRALANRGDARLAASEEVTHKTAEATSQQYERAEASSTQKTPVKSESSLLHDKFQSDRRRALGFSIGSVACFVLGVGLGSVLLLA